MECKDELNIPRTAFGYGFNRDIVECKVFIALQRRSRRYSFNRDIVECKVIFFHVRYNAGLVLIET